MLRDNLMGLIEPMRISAGANPLALSLQKQGSDDRPSCLENPRPDGTESSLTENVNSPFQAEPAQSGVPVHYCAEQFSNDGSLPSLIMKALKRMMAAEYSREMGVKIVAGQKRLTLLGFKQGGAAGYGLRRMLLSHTGERKQLLAPGERKSITTDRVILVPGPAHEVQVVKDIFRTLISENQSISNIARKLNAVRVPRPGSAKWTPFSIQSIVTNPKYGGCSVFGKTTSRLYTPIVKLPRSEWTIKPGAFVPIIDAVTFAEAQKAYEGRHYPRTDQELLDDLRKLLDSKGRLSARLINHSPDVASVSTYGKRFGSLQNSYRLIRYGHPHQFDRVASRIRTMSARKELMAQIAQAFPNEVSIKERDSRCRSRLRLAGGLIVSVLIALPLPAGRRTRSWLIVPIRRERKFVTLLARLDSSNHSFQDFYVFPNIDRPGQFQISLTDSWLDRGKRLNELSQLLELVRWARDARSTKPPS